MRVLSIAAAMISGLLILLGYFFPSDTLLAVRMFLLEWAIILAAVAMFVGGINLLSVHLEKMRAKQKNAIYSFLLVFTLVFTLLIGLIPPGPNGPFLGFMLDAVIVPVEGTLLALLTVTLLYASVRLFGRRVDLTVFLFLGMAEAGALVRHHHFAPVSIRGNKGGPLARRLPGASRPHSSTRGRG